jgi:hypothetical protein
MNKLLDSRFKDHYDKRMPLGEPSVASSKNLELPEEEGSIGDLPSKDDNSTKKPPPAYQNTIRVTHLNLMNANSPIENTICILIFVVFM